MCLNITDHDLVKHLSDALSDVQSVTQDFLYGVRLEGSKNHYVTCRCYHANMRCVFGVLLFG